MAAFLLTAGASIAQTPVQITEFPVGGEGVPITVGSDGNFWMSFDGADYMARMTPNGAVSVFSTGGVFNEIVFGHCVDGHDGGVWCSNGGRPIVRTDEATGATSRFDGFPPDSGANDLTLGPDGMIWFTDLGHIGRMTLAGVVTEYSIPPAFIFPRSITVGPDRALWFTSDVGQVGRLDTTGGGFRYYNLPEYPTLTAQLGAITTGPDDNLWLSVFTDAGAVNIVRLTLNGQITEFPVASPGSNILDITAGPDQALWFTENAANRIGRITVTGSLTEYDLAPGAGPLGITVGNDGAIWFTEGNALKVGRLSGGPLPTRVVPALSPAMLVALGAMLAIAGWFLSRGRA